MLGLISCTFASSSDNDDDEREEDMLHDFTSPLIYQCAQLTLRLEEPQEVQDVNIYPSLLVTLEHTLALRTCVLVLSFVYV